MPLLVAAVGAVVLAGQRQEASSAENLDRWTSPGARCLSALLFAIGAAGVLFRRSPLLVLLCLELMLNAGSLALVAFSRATRNPRTARSSP